MAYAYDSQLYLYVRSLLATEYFQVYNYRYIHNLAGYLSTYYNTDYSCSWLVGSVIHEFIKAAILYCYIIIYNNIYMTVDCIYQVCLDTECISSYQIQQHVCILYYDYLFSANPRHSSVTIVMLLETPTKLCQHKIWSIMGTWEHHAKQSVYSTITIII